MSSTILSKSTANFSLKFDYIVTLDSKPPYRKRTELFVENGVVVSIGEASKESGFIGIPPLVDAHTHLELHCLRGLVRGRPLSRWIVSMAKRRGLMVPDAVVNGVREGLLSRFLEGTFYVGEISSLGLDLGVSVDLPVKVRFYKEFIRDFNETLFPDGTGLGISPHAPYSAREKVLRNTARFSRERKIPFSIHLLETCDEKRLFSGEPSDLEKVLRNNFGVKRNFSKYGSLISYLEASGVFEAFNPSFVHLTCADYEVLQRIKECGGFAVLCPSSNLYIEGKLPPVLEMVEALGPERIGIGTDGPSSGPFQSIWDEMRLLYIELGLDPATIFKMASFGGRGAIGFGGWSLAPGSSPELVIVRSNPVMGDDDLFHFLMHVKSRDIVGYIVSGNLVWRKDLPPFW